jgi:LPXTG-site transpeptidase (sortase) family protein
VAVHSLSFPSFPSVVQIVRRKLPWVFLSISVISFIIAGYLFWERYFNPFSLDFFGAPKAAVVSKFSFLPVRIVIPDLKIDLPVVSTQLIDGHWPTTPMGVSYLSTSARPGDNGNSIFYGHNWPRILGNLYRIKTGQAITVNMSNGKIVNYIVSQILKVAPDDTGVLVSTYFKQLILYTCTGFADSQRLVVIAHVQTVK